MRWEEQAQLSDTDIKVIVSEVEVKKDILFAGHSSDVINKENSDTLLLQLQIKQWVRVRTIERTEPEIRKDQIQRWSQKNIAVRMWANLFYYLFIF